jgi:hypothetical protein
MVQNSTLVIYEKNHHSTVNYDGQMKSSRTSTFYLKSYRHSMLNAQRQLLNHSHVSYYSNKVHALNRLASVNMYITDITDTASPMRNLNSEILYQHERSFTTLTLPKPLGFRDKVSYDDTLNQRDHPKSTFLSDTVS